MLASVHSNVSGHWRCSSGSTMRTDPSPGLSSYRTVEFLISHCKVFRLDGRYSCKDANVLDWTANGDPLPSSWSFILNTCRLLDTGKAFMILERISSSIGNGF